jgi:hypothetical protein
MQRPRATTWKKAHPSITHCATALLCIVAVAAIEFLGGWRGLPLAILVLPAEVAPIFIWLVSVFKLIAGAIRSIMANSQIYLACGTLAAVVLFTWAFISFGNPDWVRCYGLKTHFACSVGYAKMRDFAKEVSQKQGFEGFRRDSSDESRAIWDDLASRYPFLSWNGSAGQIWADRRRVSLYWGSALVGHLGFTVAVDGRLPDSDAPEDRTQSIKVSPDIEFFSME